MCESCSGGLNRREFIATSALSAVALAAASAPGEETSLPAFPSIEKKPARVVAAFLFPPLELVEAGKLEDSWAPHRWSTWPGNQFQPEAQRKKFVAEIARMAEKIGVTVEFVSGSLYTTAAVGEFISMVNDAKPDAVLVVNFWNTFSKWAFQITQEVGVPSIVYHAVGANHQLPPKDLREAEGVYYIHSIENWEEIDRALRAVHAKTMLSQSRMIRVGPYNEVVESVDPRLGFQVVAIPAAEYNALFDSIVVDESLNSRAAAFGSAATKIADVTEHYLREAFRADQTVNRLLSRYGADAITIRCLMLEERKPCISFSINNGGLTPCGCENDYNATQTLMLGRLLFERGGFQHNPEFDTSRNQYFASHCTCATKLLGPDGPEQEYWIRPFFHQLPKMAALDVQWAPGTPVFMAKCEPEAIHCWTGAVECSPTSPPTGGCATRVLVNIDKVDDICTIYPGPHPILYRGTPEEARRLKAFAKLYSIPLKGNV